MASRRRKVVLWLAAVVVVVPALLVFTMRALRSSRSDLMHVQNNIVHVHNFITDFYGAKVGDKAILFDAGVDNDGRALDALLGELGVAGRDAVIDVYLTHGHFDHVAAAPLCKKARIHIGIQDSDMLAHREATKPTAPRVLAAILPVPAIFATDAFIDEATIPYGDKKVEAFPFPGHTPGSYLMLFDGVLFTGDSIQRSGDHLEFAMGVYSRDMEQNKKSIAGLKTLLGDRKVEVVCTGHGGCSKPGEAHKLLDDLIARAGREAK
jgi:glyoxylase-like metal-dependent hydrolase (beta-lactamase superfamily II)